LLHRQVDNGYIIGLVAFNNKLLASGDSDLVGNGRPTSVWRRNL